ncbi:MAG: restriction endonuclease [Ignavibacteriaceae bacterium]|nr:restriction endonuclease [Ignavibacteriaceae bacterium]
MSLSSTSLPKPKNWQDFENKVCELFECVLDDPNTQQNGRSGQKQNGVDVYGYRNRSEYCLVGVQCKKKYNTNVTDKELLAEVKKAKNFKPQIAEFILVTTAPRNQKIQETARQITRDLAQTNHSFRVSVWGWDDVEEHAAKYEQACKAFDPTWNSFVEAGFERITLELEELKLSFKLSVGRSYHSITLIDFWNDWTKSTKPNLSESFF